MSRRRPPARTDDEGHVSQHPPEPLADHVNVGLSIGAAVCLLGTFFTSDMVLALLAIALMTPLTALATYTAIAEPTASTQRKVLATAVAVAVTAILLRQLETLWALVLPTAAMAAGIPRARSRRPRLVAFSVLLVSLAVAGLVSLS